MSPSAAVFQLLAAKETGGEGTAGIRGRMAGVGASVQFFPLPLDLQDRPAATWFDDFAVNTQCDHTKINTWLGGIAYSRDSEGRQVLFFVLPL